MSEGADPGSSGSAAPQAAPAEWDGWEDMPDGAVRACAAVLRGSGSAVVLETSAAVGISKYLANPGMLDRRDPDPRDLEAIVRYARSPAAGGRVGMTKVIRGELTKVARRMGAKKGADELARMTTMFGYTYNDEYRPIVEAIYASEEDTPTEAWAELKKWDLEREFGPDVADEVRTHMGLRSRVRGHLAGAASGDIGIITEAMLLAAARDVILVARDGDFAIARKAVIREVGRLREGGARMKKLIIMRPSEFARALALAGG